MEEIRIIPDGNESLLKINRQRKRLLLTINLLCVFILFPFAITDLMQGYYWMGFFLLAFAVSLAINTACVFWRGREFFHYGLVSGFIVAALILAVYHKGIGAMFWVFPVVMIAIFVLPLRASFIFSVVLTSAVSVLISQEVSTADVIRIVMSLLMTVGVCFAVVISIQELQNKLRKASEEDPQTGLSNRRHLDEKLMTSLKGYESSGTPSAILLLDIDYFKTINDQFGHDIGDEVISIVAKTLKENTSKKDTAFRIGGDEFLVLLNDVNWKEGYAKAEKIRSEIETLSEPEVFSASVSVGGSMAANGLDSLTWMKKADDALYQAKVNGRNTVQLNGEA